MSWRRAVGWALLPLLSFGPLAQTGCKGCQRSARRRPPVPHQVRPECEAAEDCADDEPCTEEDCVGGRCESTPVSAGEPCSEPSPCEASRVCDGRGRCVAGPGPVIDDGDPCTLDECDPLRGVVHAPVPVDDGDACTRDACDPRTGAVTHDPVDLDDRDDCTFDSCDPRTGVAHQRPSPIHACGTGCGAGYHAASRAPSADCPGGLRSYCVPDCGPSFYSCEGACPAGYHVATRSVGAPCGDRAASVLFCRRSEGASLTTCEARCPEGYRKASEAATAQCGATEARLKSCVRQ